MKKIFLTCEHGGAQIPFAYKKLFRGHAAVLKTHRALDIGALAIALDIQKTLKISLEFSVVSRLVIDLNRFLDSPTLFSEFTALLSSKEKDRIVDLYYRPHWKSVTQQLRRLVSRKNQVFHIAVHSMTDQLHGKVRPMQLALLYNPQRQREKYLAQLWIEELRKEFPNFKIARNNPYKGNGEGLTSFFRTEFSEKNYRGIELEINQGFLKTLRTIKQRKEFSTALAKALQRAIGRV